MFLELDGHGPHYAQLTRAIKAAVLSGRLASGSQLPPTRTLAQELGLSRITVLAAYEQLRADGFITGRVGSGSYVSTLQLTPALPPPESTVTPPSRYAKRSRQVHDRMIPLLHNGLPYNLQYGNPLTNPALNTAWGRELAHAAAYTPMRGVGTQGLEALRQDFITAKYYSDISSSGIEQTALAHFMGNGGFERHLRLTRRELQARREAMVASLRHHARDRVDIVDTPAGMHVVVWLRHYDYALADALIALAHSRGLGLHPMAPHYLKRPPRPGLILGYCSLSPSALREAMKLFGECLDTIDAKALESLHVAPCRASCT